MQTLRDIAPYVAVGAAVLDVVLLAWVVTLAVRLRRLRRAQLLVLGGHEPRDIVAHAQEMEEQVRNLRGAVEDLDAKLRRHKAQLDHAFTRRAVVRYDAFNDIGGQQSASIALLDAHRSGLVVSIIHSREYARMYVKQLSDGVPDRALSPEEEQVVTAAVTGSRDQQLREPLSDDAPSPSLDLSAAPAPAAPLTDERVEPAPAQPAQPLDAQPAKPAPPALDLDFDFDFGPAGDRGDESPAPPADPPAPTV